MPLGQLWYTWAERGLEGFSRFQIVASSEDLDGRMIDFVEDARRLCSYPVAGIDVTADVAPVSFGWSDVGRTRFAFCRTHLPGSPADRRASFAAHVVFGGFAEMDLATVLATFDTGLWWTGDLRAVPEGGRLPRLAPEQLAAAPAVPSAGADSHAGAPEDPPAVAAVVAACCFGGPVALEAATLVRAMHTVAAVLPELADIGSFSSFEGAPDIARAAEEFFVFGVGPTSGGAAHSSLVARPISAALATAGRWLIVDDWSRAALRAAWSDVSTSPDRFIDWLALVDALSTPLTGDVDWSRLLPALSSPATISVLLGRADARDVLADRLAAGDDAVRHRFFLGAKTLKAALQQPMGEAIAAAALDRSAHAAAILELLPGLPVPMREALLSGAHQRLCREPVRTSRWPAELFLRLARRFRSQELPADARDVLLSGLQPVAEVVLGDMRIDAGLRSALYHGGGGRRRLALPRELLARDQTFTATLVRTAPGEDVFAELDEVLPALVLKLLGDPDSGIEAGRAARLLTRTCERMAPDEMVRGLLGLLASPSGRALVEQSGVAVLACSSFVRAYLTDVRLTADFEQLAHLAGAGAARWMALFAPLRRLTARSARSTRGLSRSDESPFLDYGVGPDGIALQFDVFAAAAGSADYVRWLADAYLDALPDEPECGAAERALVVANRCLRQTGEAAALYCLQYVAEDFAGDAARRAAMTGDWARLEPFAVHAWRGLLAGPAASVAMDTVNSKALRKNRRARAWLNGLG